LRLLPRQADGDFKVCVVGGTPCMAPCFPVKLGECHLPGPLGLRWLGLAAPLFLARYPTCSQAKAQRLASEATRTRHTSSSLTPSAGWRAPSRFEAAPVRTVPVRTATPPPPGPSLSRRDPTKGLAHTPHSRRLLRGVRSAPLPLPRVSWLLALFFVTRLRLAARCAYFCGPGPRSKQS